MPKEGRYLLPNMNALRVIKSSKRLQIFCYTVPFTKTRQKTKMEQPITGFYIQHNERTPSWKIRWISGMFSRLNSAKMMMKWDLTLNQNNMMGTKKSQGILVAPPPTNPRSLLVRRKERVDYKFNVSRRIFTVRPFQLLRWEVSALFCLDDITRIPRHSPQNSCVIILFSAMKSTWNLFMHGWKKHFICRCCVQKQ